MSNARAASLASTFQEVLTAILRVKFRAQQVQEAQGFRAQIRQSLQTTMQQARALGYNNESIQRAVFAAVAFLDESILNLQDPVFAHWARRPLQEELFGGHLAGEKFFQNLHSTLAQQDSPEVADVLEMHCLCLLMGYRGRYAFGNSGELHAMLRQARERIVRIRGEARLRPLPTPTAVIPMRRGPDPWTRRLAWTACILACFVLLAFGVYEVSLSADAPRLQADSQVIYQGGL
ncbi:DotU family type IV/VI secretion system protein [Granulicella sp. L60]|uniref:DotU family type IV/VI secretion system protein n=1 Tax=Granulicella sp. L60 TaxID=1641866 RepID=UPI00131DDF3C|nr:DotU family type IV/VI secretion system protein [Granulicella sp. L60]